MTGAPVRVRGSWTQAPRAPHGVQRHHLIPVSVLRRAQVGMMLTALATHARVLTAFPANGVLLPSTDAGVAATGWALHRGPHPVYNDVVAHRVERIRAQFVRLAPDDIDAARRIAVRQMRRLQVQTRRALTLPAVLIDDADGDRVATLNHRDPMRLIGDATALDAAIDRLFL